MRFLQFILGILNNFTQGANLRGLTEDKTAQPTLLWWEQTQMGELRQGKSTRQPGEELYVAWLAYLPGMELLTG